MPSRIQNPDGDIANLPVGHVSHLALSIGYVLHELLVILICSGVTLWMLVPVESQRLLEKLFLSVINEHTNDPQIP